MNSLQRLTILTGFWAVIVSSCTRNANRININVINRSTVNLTNVVAIGSGFTQSIDSIPANEQRSVSITPRSESGLQLEFTAKGKQFKSVPQGYFEAGSNTKVTATIFPDLKVTVDTN